MTADYLLIWFSCHSLCSNLHLSFKQTLLMFRSGPLIADMKRLKLQKAFFPADCSVSQGIQVSFIRIAALPHVLATFWKKFNFERNNNTFEMTFPSPLTGALGICCFQILIYHYHMLPKGCIANRTLPNSFAEDSYESHTLNLYQHCS